MADERATSALAALLAEHPAPWRYRVRQQGTGSVDSLEDADGKTVVFLEDIADKSLWPPIGALTEAAPEMRDELEWALGVLARVPSEHVQAIGPRWSRARALLARIEERSKGGV